MRNNFHRVFLTSYFHRVLSIPAKRIRPHTVSNLWPPSSLHLRIPLHQLLLTSWKFLVNSKIRLSKLWKSYAVNLCKKCGEFRSEFVLEMRWNVVNFFHRIHRFHRISYINLPQKSMRWIFVRNAVNLAAIFCKKCGEIIIFTAFTAITAFIAFLSKNYPKTSTREEIGQLKVFTFSLQSNFL